MVKGGVTEPPGLNKITQTVFTGTPGPGRFGGGGGTSMAHMALRSRLWEKWCRLFNLIRLTSFNELYKGL
jgi:hypothetical protein